MRSSGEPERLVLSVFLRPRIKAADGDLSRMVSGLVDELVIGLGGGDADASPLTLEDEGETASSLLTEVLYVDAFREVAVRVPGVAAALVAALDSRNLGVRRCALASISSVILELPDDVVHPLIPRLLKVLAANDLTAATLAEGALFRMVCGYARHHVAFVEAGGPDTVRRLLGEGRPWIPGLWRRVLRELHGAGWRYKAFYTLGEDGHWHVAIPEVRGCHSQGRTLNEARDQIREAFLVSLPGADLAEIVDVLQPSLAAPLAPPRCCSCGGPVLLAPKLRRYWRRERLVHVNGYTWECRDCPDPFTEDYPLRFTESALSEVALEGAKWAWQALHGEPMPQSISGRRPGAKKQVRRALEVGLERASWDGPLGGIQGSSQHVVVHAQWGAEGLSVTFADGFSARVPAGDVTRLHRYSLSAIRLTEVAPFGVMLRFGLREYEFLSSDRLRGFDG